MRPLDGKVAIVTGATKSKGLGKAIAVRSSDGPQSTILQGMSLSTWPDALVFFDNNEG